MHEKAVRFFNVHLMNFTGAESADEAAWAIANRFGWSE